jgi:hypothetical protein
MRDSCLLHENASGLLRTILWKERPVPISGNSGAEVFNSPCKPVSGGVQLSA